ncbi:MAG: RagB/SusD family nutrient uptake outer membrane protein [Tannerella sp.]|nr:RagB/SusD family nutrient uptake outer membrane protein [Tannerella sp.]
MKHSVIYSIPLIILVISSCNDDFMNRLPQTEIGVESFFNTEEDLKMYCYNLYDFPSSWEYVSDAGTDNQATTSAKEIKNIMISTNPNSTTISAGWNWTRLRDINLFLENCEKASVPADVLAHYQGVARFFRARFYMEKVQRFSDVPWYDKALTTSDEDLYKARDMRSFVIDKIFDDYAFAAEHVKTNQEKGTVDKWIVLAYMARHALYEGTFRKYHNELNLQNSVDGFLKIAVDASSQIINEGNFRIYNTGNPESDYSELFKSTDLSVNPEIIQATYYDYKVLKGGFWAYMFGNYEACPTKDLLQAYLMKDGSFYSLQPEYQTRQFTDEFNNRDPRLIQTYASPGWELINNSTYAPGAGIYVQTFNKNFSGYHQIKGFINNKDEEHYESVDFPVIRYAEILLIYAEALAEQGSLTQSDLNNTINLLRARAGLPDMTLYPETDPVMQSAFPGLTSQLLEIRRERRVELALEGYRFDDLMRWKAGKLLEKEPEGIYFPSLGKFDLTGDGIEDIYLIPSSESIPPEADKEENSLGKKLVYYKTGTIDDTNATVYLTEGNKGNIITIKNIGEFKEPQFYYRPVPKKEVDLNPNLAPQLFGWE